MALVFSHILLPMNNAIGTGFEKCWNSVVVRASTAGVVNVPNAKYLAHLPHQIQK